MSAAKRRRRAAAPPPPAKPRNVVAEARGRSGSSRASSGKLWEHTKGILGVILIFFVIRIFLVEAYRIPSESMVPTLLVGDWLFVNKLAYGPHIPFTSINLPGYRSPQHNDVVVFESPYQGDEAARGADPTPTLVKRLIGEPGDTIYMRKGVLFIDGVQQRPPFTPLPPPPPEEADYHDDLMNWQRPFGLVSSRFGAAPAVPTHDNWGPLVIPARHYFMMGDNRYDSKDSRYWGFVPRENVRGRPMFVYYSWNAGSDRPLPALTDIRWGRIGHWIR